MTHGSFSQASVLNGGRLDEVGAETGPDHQPHVQSLPEREAVLGYIETDGAEVQRARGDWV